MGKDLLQTDSRTRNDGQGAPCLADKGPGAEATVPFHGLQMHLNLGVRGAQATRFPREHGSRALVTPSPSCCFSKAQNSHDDDLA